MESLQVKMVNIIKHAKPKELTLIEFLKLLREEAGYIKRITQREGIFVIETGYNYEAKRRFNSS